MFTLSPFSPVQYYEQVQPAPRVGRASERPFTAPEQDATASRKKARSEHGPSPQEQALRGFGASATLLSSALLAELGRQATLPVRQEGQQQTEPAQDEAVEDRKRKSSDTGANAEAEADAVGALAFSVSSTPDVVPGPVSGQAGQTGTASPPLPQASAANENALGDGADRSLLLVRLQRARSVYAQAQMASGDYALARSAELFQMVA